MVDAYEIHMEVDKQMVSAKTAYLVALTWLSAADRTAIRAACVGPMAGEAQHLGVSVRRVRERQVQFVGEGARGTRSPPGASRPERSAIASRTATRTPPVSPTSARDDVMVTPDCMFGDALPLAVLDTQSS